MSREKAIGSYESSLPVGAIPSTRDEDFESKMILFLKGLIQKKYPLRNVRAHTSRDMKEYIHYRTLTDILDELERSEYA